MTPRGPPAGRAILVTRPRDRATPLVNLLDQRGATVVEAPSIELRPVRSADLTRALRDLAAGGFAWIVLTSPATVRMLDERLDGPREVATKVAGNTANIPQLEATAPVLGLIVQEAVVQDGYMNALTDGFGGA